MRVCIVASYHVTYGSANSCDVGKGKAGSPTGELGVAIIMISSIISIVVPPKQLVDFTSKDMIASCNGTCHSML
jgi:hypothetical protein